MQVVAQVGQAVHFADRAVEQVRVMIALSRLMLLGPAVVVDADQKPVGLSNAGAEVDR